MVRWLEEVEGLNDFQEARNIVLQEIGSECNFEMWGEENIHNDEECKGETMNEVMVHI